MHEESWQNLSYQEPWPNFIPVLRKLKFDALQRYVILFLHGGRPCYAKHTKLIHGNFLNAQRVHFGESVYLSIYGTLPPTKVQAPNISRKRTCKRLAGITKTLCHCTNQQTIKEKAPYCYHSVETLPQFFRHNWSKNCGNQPKHEKETDPLFPARECFCSSGNQTFSSCRDGS